MHVVWLEFISLRCIACRLRNPTCILFRKGVHTYMLLRYEHSGTGGSYIIGPAYNPGYVEHTPGMFEVCTIHESGTVSIHIRT